MNILVCYAVTDRWRQQSSANGLVYAFKKMGHNIKTCGPTIGNYDLPIKSSGQDMAILDKKNHPETYDYQEILSFFDMQIDLIIQTDPHFYLKGRKPNIPCVYWIMDVHRGPIVFREMAQLGNFDILFISQKYYMPVFERTGIRCEYLPWCYDSINVFEEKNIEPQCDIIFVGSTGIKNFKELPRECDKEIDFGYVSDVRLVGKQPDEKYEAFSNFSFEYAERAESLIRLMKDFSVRIYDFAPIEDGYYRKVLSRGKIVFHRSLRRDITLRLFEGAAVNRLVLADEIPYIDEVMADRLHYVRYRPYYQPQFAGFDLDYEEIRDLVEYYLSHDDERKEIALQGKEHVEENHTFFNRAEELLRKAFSA